MCGCGVVSLERSYRKHSGRQQKLTWYLVVTVRDALILVVLQCMNVPVEVPRNHHQAPS